MLYLVTAILPTPVAYIVADRRLDLSIAILDISMLHLHEETIPELMNYLARAINADAYIKHPIIVDQKSLVVLDGVHRVAALGKIGVRRVPACLVDYGNSAIQVLSWYRTITNSSNADKILGQIKKTDCTLESTEEKPEHLIGVSPTVAALLFRSQTFLVNHPFRHLQEAYDVIGRIEERLTGAGFKVRYEAQQDALENLRRKLASAVLCTPTISKEEIIKSALSKRIFAWKATRHVIPARPLSVNAPLILLRDRNKSLSQVNDGLRHLLKERKLRRLPAGSVVDGRRYEEELYVFEE